MDVNEHFDGDVKSIGFQAETLRATVGVMAPGADEWSRFDAGSGFVVEANQKFQLQVAVDTAYLCTCQ
jgi:uncharacterized protein YaiE (UPF0345 family)